MPFLALLKKICALKKKKKKSETSQFSSMLPNFLLALSFFALLIFDILYCLFVDGLPPLDTSDSLNRGIFVCWAYCFLPSA